MEVDSDYEFNAPKYIDFLSNEPENDHIDTWFDENPDGHEGGIRISQVPFIRPHLNYETATRAISAALETSSNPEGGECNAVENLNENPGKSNINTEQPPSQDQDASCSYGVKMVVDHVDHESNTKTQTNDNVKADKEMDENVEQKADSKAQIGNASQENGMNETINLKIQDKEDETKVKSTKRATRSSTPVQKQKTPLSGLRKRKHSWNQNSVKNENQSKEEAKDGTKAKKSKVDVKKPLITMPNTPSFLRRLRGKVNNDKKTSEAREIEKIKELQERTKKRLKNNETFLQKALAHQKDLPPKKVAELTKNMEFHFATDARLKQHPMTTRGDTSGNENFVGQLRKHPPSPSFKNKKPTKPQPFKFSAGQKLNKPEQGGQWKSMASAVNEFQSKTPERWRSRPNNQPNLGPQINEKNKTKMELTHPKTPQLMTKGRSRPLSVPSQAELENKIADEVSNFKFRAREFNPKLVEMSGMYGVEPMKQLPVTEAKPFSFNSDARLEHRKKLEDDKKKEEKLQKQHEQETVVEKRNTSVDSNPGKKRPKITDPKPFSFEERDRQRLQMKQKKIQKVYEEEEKAREFHAQPLPSLSPDMIPVRSGKHTEIAAFNLATDERGAVKMEKWTAQVTQELESEKEKTTFKARPCKVIHQEGFKPKPTSKPLVEISEFKLNTEERSKKRESYEIQKKEQQRMKEDEMQQVLKEKKEEEERQIALLRKQAVHKANPIRNFGDFEVKPSERPLTLPETPKFETTRRLGKLSRA